jgi:hypothetical protein
MNIRATVPGEKFEQVKKGAQKTNGVTVLITKKASAIKPKAIRWMWPDRFALGKLGLIGGMPDKGKGLITCDLIACITSGHPLPCEEGNTPHGSVLYFTAEDDYNDTVVPRLMAAGANLDKVDIVQMMDDSGNPCMFNMVTDLAALKTKIEEIGDVIMVVIDPMSAYQGHGKINQASTSDIRSFLCPLTDMASELRVFILASCTSTKRQISPTPCFALPTAWPMSRPRGMFTSSWMIPRMRGTAYSSRQRTILPQTRKPSVTRRAQSLLEKMKRTTRRYGRRI